MLRKRGISSRLCLGASIGNSKPESHAWVVVGTRIVIGEKERPRFVTIAEFGDGSIIRPE